MNVFSQSAQRWQRAWASANGSSLLVIGEHWGREVGFFLGHVPGSFDRFVKLVSKSVCVEVAGDSAAAQNRPVASFRCTGAFG
jgi:hypothetical protein